MEASSTTVNISGTIPLEVQEPPQHNHLQMNRYKKGCPACEVRKAQQMATFAPSTTIDEAVYLNRIAELEAQLEAAKTAPAEPRVTSTNATDQLVALMLDEQADRLHKRKEDEARKALTREADLQAAKEQQTLKLAREANCEAHGHKKENGRSAIANGQVYNNGMTRPFCTRCFKTWPWQKPNADQISTALV